jgi:hypothetical protein
MHTVIPAAGIPSSKTRNAGVRNTGDPNEYLSNSGNVVAVTRDGPLELVFTGGAKMAKTRKANNSVNVATTAVRFRTISYVMSLA